MIIEINRSANLTHSTIGSLYIDGEFFCFTLEDEAREVKIAGDTRIPAGAYTLGIREADTKLTNKYRDKYDFFKFHLHVKQVPGFEYIYIHAGNTHKHTDGCILLGYSAHAEGTISRSGDAFRDFYTRVYPRIWEKEGTIIIKD